MPGCPDPILTIGPSPVQTREGAPFATFNVTLAPELLGNADATVTVSLEGMTVMPEVTSLIPGLAVMFFLVEPDDTDLEAPVQAYDIQITLSSADPCADGVVLHAPGEHADNDKRLFLSMPLRGNMGGLVVADSICQQQAELRSLPGDYQAMLVQAGVRVATTTRFFGPAEGQLDWVLSPSTDYFRTDGSHLGRTSGDGLFEFMGDAPPPRVQPWTDEPTATVWTGMEQDWTAIPMGDCGGWSVTGASGAYGDGDALDASAISVRHSTTNQALLSACNDQRSLVCVQR